MPHLLGPARVRVVVQHTPHLFAILGLHEVDACPLVLRFANTPTTFFRARSTDRWVLYKPAVQGWGETKTLDRHQR